MSVRGKCLNKRCQGQLDMVPTWLATGTGFCNRCAGRRAGVAMSSTDGHQYFSSWEAQMSALEKIGTDEMKGYEDLPPGTGSTYDG